MRRMLINSLSLLCLSLGAFEGCSSSHRQVNGGVPENTPRPTRVSSSDVVKVQTTGVAIPAGGEATATVTLSIASGFHVNANPATFSYLIPTEVRHVVDPDEGLPLMGKPIYPGGIKKKFAFAEQPLAVYEGDITIGLPLRLSTPGKSYVVISKGAHLSFPIDVRVQACDNEQCFPPATLNTSLPIDVK